MLAHDIDTSITILHYKNRTLPFSYNLFTSVITGKRKEFIGGFTLENHIPPNKTCCFLNLKSQEIQYFMQHTHIYT